MRIFRAFGEGVRSANRSLTIIWVLYGLNLIIAGVIALLFRSTLFSALGSSLAFEQMLAGFDYSVYTDFLIKNPGKLNIIFQLVVWFVVINNFISLFFDGGIIANAQSTEKPTLKSFFAGCGEFILRFLVLFIVFLIVAIVLIFILGILSSTIYQSVANDGATEIQALSGAGAVMAVFIIPFTILILINDYARVITVANEEKKILRAFWHGTVFVLKKILSTYGLFLLCLLLTLILIATWLVLSIKFTPNTTFTIVGFFVLQQVVVFARAWMRVVSVSSQMKLYINMKSKVEEEVQIISTVPKSSTLPPIETIPESNKLIEEVSEEKKKTARIYIKRKRPISRIRGTQIKRIAKRKG